MTGRPSGEAAPVEDVATHLLGPTTAKAMYDAVVRSADPLQVAAQDPSKGWARPRTVFDQAGRTARSAAVLARRGAGRTARSTVPGAR